MNLFRSRFLALVPLVLSVSGRADDWAPNLTATAIWHSNATQADRSADQLDALEIKGDLLASQRYPFGRDDALHLTGHFAGDWWPRYNGLLDGAAGGRIEWRHKFGVDAHAPTAAIQGAADAVSAKETGRRGVSTGITASVRKRFNDLTRATLWHEVGWFDARYGTYDRGASETALEIDRDLTDVARLTFTARYCDGDVVSYAAGTRPDLEALAPNRLAGTSFGRAMTAYRVDARTWSARLAIVRALNESSAIVVAYERRESERGSLRFTDHLLSVGLVHQF